MSDKASSSPTESSQEQNQSVKLNRHRRRQLEHLADIQNGVMGFTMVPRAVSDAWLNGSDRMPDAKFKLLYCFMSHSDTFHPSSSYLRARFSPKTIQKYRQELIDEGYIRLEIVPCLTGGHENIVHVNPLAEWDLVRNPDDCSQRNSSQRNSSQRNTLNETKGNKNKKNENNGNTEREKTEPETQDTPSFEGSPLQDASAVEKADSKPKKVKTEKLEPRKGNPAHHEAVKEMILEAKTAGLKVDPDSLALTVDNCVQKLGATIPIIRETWPLAIVGMLEKGNSRPAAAFFNWMRFEMQQRSRLSQQKQYSPRQRYQQKQTEWVQPTQEEYEETLAVLPKPLGKQS